MSEPTSLPVLHVAPGVAIGQEELAFQFSRSTGPGGQNVNRRETQVELSFDVGNSPSLSADQRERLLRRLKGQIDSRGILHVVANSQRSQLQNRREAVDRFVSLVRWGLEEPRRRQRTLPSRQSRLRRLTRKRRRSETKRLRRTSRPDSEE